MQEIKGVLNESGDFAFNTPSRPITFNDTGRFNYLEADVNDNDPSFVMNGTINVINQANSLTGTNATAGSPDTVGTLMVPAVTSIFWFNCFCCFQSFKRDGDEQEDIWIEVIFK